MAGETMLLNDLYNTKITYMKGEIFPSFFDSVPHSHDHSEIFINISGEIDIFAETNMYHLTGGEVRLYAGGELHCGKTDKPQYMEWYQISLDKEFFEENRTLGKVLFDRNFGTKNVFYSKKYEEMVFLLNELFAVWRNDNELWINYGKSTVLRILCLLNETENNTDIDVKNSDVMKKLVDLINLDFRNISTVKDLCERTYYSPAYINRVFASSMNVTPYRFILGKKLNEAKNALRTGASVTEACEYAGFNSYSNFITLFHKQFGVTPKKYRDKFI